MSTGKKPTSDNPILTSTGKNKRFLGFSKILRQRNGYLRGMLCPVLLWDGDPRNSGASAPFQNPFETAKYLLLYCLTPFL